MNSKKDRGEQACEMFDSFCKRVIRNELWAEIKALRLRLLREVLMPEIPERTGLITWIDTYPSDSFSIMTNDWAWGVQGETLYLAIERLSPKQRQMILLSYWHGYRDREIAQVMKMPRSTVNYRRNIAIKRLKLILEAHINDIET